MSKATVCDRCHKIIRYCCVSYRIKRYANGNDSFIDSSDYDICASCLEEITGKDLISIMR